MVYGYKLPLYFFPSSDTVVVLVFFVFKTSLFLFAYFECFVWPACVCRVLPELWGDVHGHGQYPLHQEQFSVSESCVQSNSWSGQVSTQWSLTQPSTYPNRFPWSPDFDILNFLKCFLLLDYKKKPSFIMNIEVLYVCEKWAKTIERNCISNIDAVNLLILDCKELGCQLWPGSLSPLPLLIVVIGSYVPPFLDLDWLVTKETLTRSKGLTNFNWKKAKHWGNLKCC